MAMASPVNERLKNLGRCAASILIISAVAALSGCSRPAEKPAEPAPSLQQPPAPAPPPELAGTAALFDLGGPCAPGGEYGRSRITSKREAELFDQHEWDALIEAQKINIREACSIPYRWERLFTTLVAAHRYAGAAQLLAEVSRRGFPFPHAIISAADSAFLASPEFRNSSVGIQYAKRETEVQNAFRVAAEHLSSMDASELPPNPYRHAGACPFECCTYREWKTRSAVQLRESVESDTIVAEIPAGTRVNALTGEVILEPVPYAVLADGAVLKAGDVIFLLDSQGEGYAHYWYNGKLDPEIGLKDGLLYYMTETCNSNTARNGQDVCRLKKLQPEKTTRTEWWVKIRATGGKIGWTLNTGQFENTDACG